MDKKRKIGYNKGQKFQRRNSMKQLRTKYHRWLVRNRDKGIPNLMLFVMLANVLIYCYCTIANGSGIYSALCYDSAKILHGQVWRLISFIFYPVSFDFLALFAFYFYYLIGNTLERYWGTPQFTIFFFSGVILSEIFAFIVYFVSGMSLNITATYIYSQHSTRT